jgi:hypothetical protein
MKKGFKYLMIMEDLEERGFVKPDREKPFDVKVFKLIVEYFLNCNRIFGVRKAKKT